MTITRQEVSVLSESWSRPWFEQTWNDRQMESADFLRQ